MYVSRATIAVTEYLVTGGENQLSGVLAAIRLAPFKASLVRDWESAGASIASSVLAEDISVKIQ